MKQHPTAMRTAQFALSLASAPLAEFTLTWEHPVTLLAARAVLLENLDGAAPACIRVTGPAGGCEFWFHPPCGAGARRVATQGLAIPMHLARGEKLLVGGIRDGGVGVWRVELDYARPRSARGSRSRDRGARLAPEVGHW